MLDRMLDMQLRELRWGDPFHPATPEELAATGGRADPGRDPDLHGAGPPAMIEAEERARLAERLVAGYAELAQSRSANIGAVSRAAGGDAEVGPSEAAMAANSLLD
jgi:hypothetical protein